MCVHSYPVKGEKSYGIGGGICQVSSTVYMAAVNAGMKITEHYPHSEKVAYAPSGKDATVVYGRLDFQFKNDKFASKIKVSALEIYSFKLLRNNKIELLSSYRYQYEEYLFNVH